MFPINKSILEFAISDSRRYFRNPTILIIIIGQETHDWKIVDVLLARKNVDVAADHLPDDLLRFEVVEICVD